MRAFLLLSALILDSTFYIVLILLLVYMFAVYLDMRRRKAFILLIVNR